MKWKSESGSTRALEVLAETKRPTIPKSIPKAASNRCSVKNPINGNTYTNRKNEFTSSEPIGPPKAFQRLFE
jgi:hypothetical protein